MIKVNNAKLINKKVLVSSGFNEYACDNINLVNFKLQN